MYTAILIHHGSTPRNPPCAWFCCDDSRQKPALAASRHPWLGFNWDGFDGLGIRKKMSSGMFEWADGS
jgi:hypothetical protein